MRMLGSNNHQYGLKGTLNSSWKTNEKTTHYGYKKIRVLDHPFRDCDDFVFEHRLTAEQFLLTEENSIEISGKRYLKPEYIVHHKDGNKLNNNPNNLEVMLKGKHSSFHNKINPVERDLITGRFISNKGDGSLRL